MAENEFWVFPFVALAEIGDAALSRPNAATSTIAFVLVAALAPEFMSTPVFGNVNLGIVLGLSQFVTTFGITMWYVSFANRRLDPLGAELREQLEGAENK